MVASSQPLATAAGLEILSRGGNAADAAVATAAALNVTEPTSTGLGGDMFALFFESGTGKVTALNGSGRAPAALTLALLQETAGATSESPLPPYHPLTITVPGACAGWCDLVERHGTMSLSDIFAPAIRLAEMGFPVSPVTSHFWQRGAERQLKTSLNGIEMTMDGRAPNPGELFRNPALARTLKTVAERRKGSFLRGGNCRIDSLYSSAGRWLPDSSRFGFSHQHLGQTCFHFLRWVSVVGMSSQRAGDNRLASPEYSRRI